MSTPLTAEQYIDTAHREIVSRSRTRRGVTYPFSCGIVAIDLAQIHIDEGHEPVIWGLRGQPRDAMGNTKQIIPRMYRDTVSWGAHLVCVNEDTAYDPIVGEPLHTDTYLDETFVERPEINCIFRGKELVSLVATRRSMLTDVRDGAPFVVLSDMAMLHLGNQ